MSDRSKARARRDGLIFGAALIWGSFEVFAGGGRPSVLTFVSTLLLSPLALRFDEARRGRK